MTERDSLSVNHHFDDDGGDDDGDGDHGDDDDDFDDDHCSTWGVNPSMIILLKSRNCYDHTRVALLIIRTILMLKMLCIFCS